MEERRENMRRLRDCGYSYGRIAQLYGISRQRVHQLASGYAKNLRRVQGHNGNYWKIYNTVLVRDSHKCQKCGTVENLVVHHLDGNNERNDLGNLVTLCTPCHLNLHRPSRKGSLGKPQGKRIEMATLGTMQKLLTVTQAASQLRVHRNTILRYLNDGTLQGYRLAGYRWRIPEDALGSLLEKNAGGEKHETGKHIQTIPTEGGEAGTDGENQLSSAG